MPFTKNVKLEYVPPEEVMRGISLETAMQDFLLAYNVSPSRRCSTIVVRHIGGGALGHPIVGVYAKRGSIDYVSPDETAPRRVAEDIRFHLAERNQIEFRSSRADYRINLG